jgi:hypothetical protein
MESEECVTIKIASSSNLHHQKKQYHHQKEKFRFLTNRTFNGPRNPNWRSSPKSFVTRSSFPDCSFFQRTPPPSHSSPPPPPPPPPPSAPACPMVTPMQVSPRQDRQAWDSNSTAKQCSAPLDDSSPSPTSL